MSNVRGSTIRGILPAFLLIAALFLTFLPEIRQQVLSFPAAAASDNEPVYVHASLLADCKAITPGKKFKLGVELKMDPGWHIYYKESGEAGMPTKVSWDLPSGFKASDLLWEMPHKIVDAGIVTYGYGDRTLIASEIQAPEGLKAGEKIKFKAVVKWLSCKDSCVPGSGAVEIVLPVAAGAEQAVPDNSQKFEKVYFNGPISEVKEVQGAENSGPKKSQGSEFLVENFGVEGSEKSQAGILAYLGFALLGGFILNFMPCVLPVISIKVFSLVQQAGEDSRRVFQHGVVFALGIILSFLALGGFVIAIQSAGQKIGWGFQFQYPVFVLCMSSVVTVFALSMFGVFYLDFSAGQKPIDRLSSTEGLYGTFFKGVLATMLSTPCTAPFLGTALGFAFAQPWWDVLGIFFAIGLGMSLPYLVLAVRPDWMRFLPRPGDWMEKFKQSLGFLLLATAIWLISVLGGLVDIEAVIAAMAFLVTLALSSWIVGSFIDLTSSAPRRAVVWCLALLVVSGGFFAFLSPYPELLGTQSSRGLKRNAGGIEWREFSLSELQKELKEGKTVFVDFTAQWCLTCKANEAAVINTPPVIERIKLLKVVPLKADWTAQDEEITELLRKFGRSGVPLYVIFPGGHPDRPLVLPEIITQEILLNALEKAGASKQ